MLPYRLLQQFRKIPQLILDVFVIMYMILMIVISW